MFLRCGFGKARKYFHVLVFSALHNIIWCQDHQNMNHRDISPDGSIKLNSTGMMIVKKIHVCIAKYLIQNVSQKSL